MFKNLYFLVVVWFFLIKKGCYIVKVHETVIPKWDYLCFNHKSFRSYAYSCKAYENQKNGMPWGHKL